MAKFLHCAKFLIAAFFLSSQVYAKELTILVYDMADGITANAQIVAKYISKYDPEITNVIFKEIPNSNGISLMNYLYTVSSKNGYEIAAIPWNVFSAKLTNKNLTFKLQNFMWLGSNIDGREQPLILWHNKLSTELIAGSEVTQNFTRFSFINYTLHKNIKEIKGYQNSSVLRMAFERGEVSLMVNNLAGIKTIAPQWLSDPNIEPIIQYGNGKNRSVDYPNVPTLSELATTKEDLELINYYELQSAILRPFVAPPNADEKQIFKLRNALWSVFNDQDFIAEVKKRGIDGKPMDWKTCENIVNMMVSADPAIVARFSQIK